MNHQTKTYNTANLLSHLTEKKLLDNSENCANFILSGLQEQELPLYLRVLAGVGAFIASLCFIGFLSIAGIISFKSEAELITWGLIFAVGAIGLQRGSGSDNTVKHSFLMQSSFASMAVGKTLFIIGMAQLLDSGWGVPVATLIITAITYHIYRMSIDRFLSSFAVLVSILTNILWDYDLGLSRELMFNAFFLFQFFGAAILLTHGKIKRDYTPLAYAFVFSIAVSVLFLASQAEFGYWQHKDFIHSIFVNIVLSVGLISLFGWAAGSLNKLKSTPLMWASAAAVVLGFVSAPGIILAIGFMILGYAKHEKILMISGALLMPLVLFLYYYNLDISLLQKSAILTGSGVILLMGSFYIRHRGWDKEAV